MPKHEVFVVMVITDPHGNPCPDKDIAFWAKRIVTRFGHAVYKEKEVARADARKFTEMMGFKYQAVRCDHLGRIKK